MSEVAMFNLSQPNTTQAGFPLGAVVTVGDIDYQYLKASGTIAQYALVTIDVDFTAVEGTTGTSGARPTRCAIPQVAVATTEYFWAPIGPFPESAGFKVKAQTSCGADVKLYTHATAGTVDDTATDLIEGLVLTETITTAAAATCEAVKRLLTNCQD